ncbi:MAG: hypothetical protein AAF571_11850 [Verrucomicrobiota bacterium]
MSASTAIWKWAIVPALILVAGLGFIAGRMTGDSVGDSHSDESPAQTSGINRFFGAGTENGNAAPTSSTGGPSTLVRPEGGYTKQTLIEAAQELNLFAGGGGPKKMREMLAVQEALAQQDVRALVDELMADQSSDAQQALYLAMGVYVEQSPIAALELVLDQASNPQLNFSLYQAVSVGMQLDPEGTLARLSGIENKVTQQKAMSSALMAMSMKDPERALDLYLNSGLVGSNDHSIHTIFHQWARKDPASAANALDQIQDDRQRQQATSGLVSNWMQQDREAAWELVQSQPVASQSYQDPRYHALTSWARTDPEAALMAAEALPDKVKKQALPNVVSNWARNDPEAALTWLLAHDDAELMGNTFRNISYSDAIEPQRLFDLVVEKMPAGNSFRNTVSQVVNRWAQKDPNAAANALLSLPPGDAFNNSAGNLIRQWSGKDPAAAFQWATSLPEGAGRNNTVRSWFNAVAADQPQLAESYYQQLDSSQQNEVASSIASSLVNADPAAAIRFTAALTDEKIRRNAQDSIARNWARQDPQQAGLWANSLPDGEKSRAIRNVIDSWANNNVEAAAEWLASIPVNPSLDEATHTLSRKLAGVDPAAAVDWAGSITNEKTRERALYDAAREWIRNDPANGKAWVQSSNLTQQQKDKLLK